MAPKKSKSAHNNKNITDMFKLIKKKNASNFDEDKDVIFLSSNNQFDINSTQISNQSRTDY